MAFRELDSTDAIIITGVAVAAVTGGAALAMSIKNSQNIKAVSAVAQDTAQRMDIMANIVAQHKTEVGLSDAEIMRMMSY